MTYWKTRKAAGKFLSRASRRSSLGFNQSIAAAGVACSSAFFGGNYLFKIINGPLLRSPLGNPATLKSSESCLGTTNCRPFISEATNDVLASFAGTNRFVTLQMVPIPISRMKIRG